LEFVAEEEIGELKDIMKSNFQNIDGMEARIMCIIEESERRS